MLEIEPEGCDAVGDGDLSAFRAGVAAWLEAQCPPLMRTPIKSAADLFWGGRSPHGATDDQKLWLDRMVSKGWTAPSWPREYGGAGLSPAQEKILREEMVRLGCRPPLKSFGISMLGPVLLKYGSDEQKARHLPPIARGEIRWCQGYSEPGAGSDLAGLQMRAVLVDESEAAAFVVNGQKVWTSHADKSDWMFCLVRTDMTAKHAGISFLLIDMSTPGVAVRPIILISGHSPFCETFFDDVKVPAGNLIGTINGGWEIAKFLLSHEREMISGMGLSENEAPLGQVAADALGRDAAGRLDDPVLRARIAMYSVRARAFGAMSERFFDELKAGVARPAQPSMMKFFGTELSKLRNELTVAAVGARGLEWDSERSSGGLIARNWLRSKGNSIEGGTSEIQLNIVAKRILELPAA